MTTMSTRTGTRPSLRLRTGLAITALLAVASRVPLPSGGDGPSFAIVILAAFLSIVMIACAAVAWRSGNRLAIRINAAALLLNALLALPVFFVVIDAWVKVGGAAVVVLTVAALVLTLRPEHQPFTATD
ncbi:MAG: hypothetical protein ABI112_09415 [Terracoccus sp.]